MNNSFKSKVPLFIVKVLDTIQLLTNFFFNRKKITGKHKYEEPFFIIGCGRSGNTLLRSMLVAGGEVAIPPESYVWPRIIRIFQTYNFLPWEKLCSLIIAEFEAYKEFYTWEVNLYIAHKNARILKGKEQTLSNIINEVYKAYQLEKTGKIKRWGDKTPINTLYIDKILKVYPNAKFIHIVREPKDVVCSYINAKLYNDIDEATNFWNLAVKKALFLKNKVSSNQFIQVRYEDLVVSPEIQLNNVCDFLDLEYTRAMLDFWKETKSLGDVNYGKHHANIKKPLSSDSIGKWKKKLSEKERIKIDKLTKDLQEKLNL